MRKELAWLLVALLPLTASCVGTSEAKKPPKKAAASLGIDETALDKTVNPCDDFYQYACGNWIKRTPIPADRPAWYRSFSEIDQRNQNDLKGILDKLAAGKDQGDAYAKKLGDFYSACMDEAKVEKTSDAQLQTLLKTIDQVTTIDTLAKEVADLQLGLGSPLFGFGSQQDFKDATQMIAVADQGGLGLPDRDYYLKNDAKTKELRDKYQAHVTKMLELAGEPAAQAQKDSVTVLRVEHLLAQASMSRTERRDPKKIYHRLELAGLIKEAPRFPWKMYLTELGHPNITQINVAVPGFFAALNNALSQVPMSDFRVYLRWNLIHGAAPAMSKKFVDENFNFYAKTLQGVDKILPRWKRCVAASDRALGFALAQPFVKETFGADGKAQSQTLVKDIEQAMQKNLGALSWMDDATRKNAFSKLHAIENKIGYPDKWRNYDKLEVSRDSYLFDMLHAAEFESHRDLNKIGKPVDRTEWDMTPPTVNAYYDPSMNEMVFPAGILQPPFFNRQAVPAVNFGAIGMVMGHELTHGFDDEGRQFDAKGNLVDWWTPAVSKEFDKRADCVVKQFDDYTVLGTVHLNGKLTLGENIADLGGIKLAYTAYRDTHKKPEKYGKWTDAQLFFLGTAQAWCGSRRDELARMRVLTDPHSPPEYRVNGPLSNLHEFAEAFQCKPDSK
ncbi:MAG: M13 family metallopeptidase, partial [Polyangia bacterium]